MSGKMAALLKQAEKTAGGEETTLEPERSEGFINDHRAPAETTNLKMTNMEAVGAMMAALTWIPPGCVWRFPRRQIANSVLNI